MNRTFRLATLVTLTLCFSAVAGADAQDTADEGPVKAIAAHWEKAWNDHDMKALAALFTEDADFVMSGPGTGRDGPRSRGNMRPG
jgi:hypothetical protein